jgi:hypothetical protein
MRSQVRGTTDAQPGDSVSIVNITIGKERVLVGCDTACAYATAAGGEEQGEMTKLLALPGMGVVMAYRGERGMFKRIFLPCFFGREPQNFDALVEQMPAIINTAERTQSDQATDLTLELYVVGWSHQRGRMAGAVYVIDTSGALTAAHVDTWQCASSPELPDNPSPLLDSHEAMLAHARLQTAYGNIEHAQYAIGGRFFIADMTRERITVTLVGEL